MPENENIIYDTKIIKKKRLKHVLLFFFNVFFVLFFFTICPIGASELLDLLARRGILLATSLLNHALCSLVQGLFRMSWFLYT